MSDSRFFQVGDRGDVLVLRLQPVSLDRNAANEFWADLLAAIESNSATHLVINLAKATQISSSVLAKLMALDKRLSARGGKLLLCEAVPNVNQIISLAWPGRGSDEVLTEEAAISSLAGNV
jgi:anti-anti-sigma factor